MSFEVQWFDLGSEPNFSGLELMPTEAMALEWAKMRVLFSTTNSFAFVADVTDGCKLTHKFFWENSDVQVRERTSPDWNKPRVRP